MPKKSVREMTKRERIRHSLSSRIFRFVLLGSVLLGIVCLLIGLSLYTVQRSICRAMLPPFCPKQPIPNLFPAR